MRCDAKVFVGELGGDASALGAVEKSDLHEERFVDLFNGVGLLRENCG